MSKDIQGAFRPEPRTNTKMVRHINYTCGPQRYAELEAIAKNAGISLKELLRQMVDFAVAHHVSAIPNGDAPDE